MMFKIVTYISSCYNFLSLVGFFRLGFPGGSDAGDTEFDPWVQILCWRKELLPTPVFLLGEF